jgi:hypothetical protein
VAEQRHARTGQRAAERRPISVPARLTWKDASGAVRFASVVTRDVSDAGVFVECDAVQRSLTSFLQVEQSLPHRR